MRTLVGDDLGELVLHAAGRVIGTATTTRAAGRTRRRGRDVTQDALLLLAYCLVMVLPALLLLAVRRLAARRVEPLLMRLERLASRGGAEGTLWALFIVGFLLARDAANQLGLLGG